MNWTKNRPSEPGWYWCRQYEKSRMVNVWRQYLNKKLYTNEDGGAPIDDPELYGSSHGTTLWCGPIDPPPPPCDYCDEDGMVETDNNGPIGLCPMCDGTKNLAGSNKTTIRVSVDRTEKANKTRYAPTRYLTPTPR